VIGCILEVIVTPLGAIIGVIVGVGLHLILPAMAYVVGVRNREEST